MSERKKSPRELEDIPFGEAVKRLLQTKPGELAETLAADVLQARERAKKRIQDARREIEDGARARKKRFRL
jgi:hypothetical protein